MILQSLLRFLFNLVIFPVNIQGKVFKLEIMCWNIVVLNYSIFDPLFTNLVILSLS